MALYRRIKDLREDNDKTQKQLADYLGMKQPQYYRYENGQRDIPTDILVRIADFYQVSVDYLLNRTDKREVNR